MAETAAQYFHDSERQYLDGIRALHAGQGPCVGGLPRMSIAKPYLRFVSSSAAYGPHGPLGSMRAGKLLELELLLRWTERRSLNLFDHKTRSS